MKKCDFPDDTHVRHHLQGRSIFMSKQTFRLPSWRRKPTADETAPDIADSELVPAESAARPTRHKHGKRTYVIGGALLALAIAGRGV
jgi:hypothetical protein